MTAWTTVRRRAGVKEIRTFGSALAAQTWLEVTAAPAPRRGCRCRSVRHALTAEERARTSAALIAARRAGNKDLADFYRALLAPCPTATRTETETF